VLYRTGGRESTPRSGGSFKRKTEAVARKRFLDGELHRSVSQTWACSRAASALTGSDGSPFDDPSREAGIHLDVMDGETGTAECSIDGRRKPVAGSGSQAEEVEVACLSLNVPAISAAPPASAKSFASSSPAMISATLLLKRGQHLCVAAVTSQPIGHARRTGGGRTSTSKTSRS
jgi:hypothetical protein